jgi:hypothetical protein
MYLALCLKEASRGQGSAIHRNTKCQSTQGTGTRIASEAKEGLDDASSHLALLTTSVVNYGVYCSEVGYVS